MKLGKFSEVREPVVVSAIAGAALATVFSLVDIDRFRMTSAERCRENIAGVVSWPDDPIVRQVTGLNECSELEDPSSVARCEALRQELEKKAFEICTLVEEQRGNN